MGASFSNFHFRPFINDALSDLGFTTPTPIQNRVIPAILAGKSVVGKSETGSGKTHAFLLPIFNNLDPNKHQVQAVITTPSRELAYQIYDNVKQLNKFAPRGIHVANLVGGSDKEAQIKKLENETPQLVIGTPGRIWDLVKSGSLDIHNSNQLVIDEADMTLDLGFLEVIDKIAKQMPKQLQMMVFSATIPEKLRPFLKKYMENPEIKDIPTKDVINENVANWLIPTKGKDKNDVIYQILTMGSPYLALVFANTRQRADEIYDYLQNQGLKVAKIHGGMKPRERKRVMKQIQNLDYQFVVATDLASRGIDIPGVSHVINDDIPDDSEYFVHRVGRTGRNGMSGIAITLYSPDEEAKLDELEKMGIHFQPKDIKNGEIVTGKDRKRRSHFKKKNDQLDPQMIGMIKKKKKRVKPGYKKKIKLNLKLDADAKHKVAVRNEIRAKKKQKKRSSKRYR